jgi:hypothetical protein
VSKENREVVADWTIVLGATILFVSLFVTWSHQFSPGLLAQFGSSELLNGVAHDPTAWQVYSAADVALASPSARSLARRALGSVVVLATIRPWSHRSGP